MTASNPAFVKKSEFICCKTGRGPYMVNQFVTALSNDVTPLFIAAQNGHIDVVNEHYAPLLTHHDK